MLCIPEIGIIFVFDVVIKIFASDKIRTQYHYQIAIVLY